MTSTRMLASLAHFIDGEAVEVPALYTYAYPSAAIVDGNTEEPVDSAQPYTPGATCRS